MGLHIEAAKVSGTTHNHWMLDVGGWIFAVIRIHSRSFVVSTPLRVFRLFRGLNVRFDLAAVGNEPNFVPGAPG